jgi:predicted Zn-dependent protease
MLPLLLVVFAAPPMAPELQRGFDHFYNLEYDEAVRVFQSAARARPEDPQRHNHVAQAVLYRAMLKAGALESELVSGTNPFLRREKMNPTPQEQAEFDAAIAAAFDKSNAQIAKNPKDPNALYALAVAHGLRANYNFLVRKAWMDSLRDATQARKYAELCVAADSTYTDARLILGVHDYIVGSLSWTYKVLGFLAGIRGDRDGGIRQVEQVARDGVNNKNDAKILLAAVYRREKKAARSIPLLEGLIEAFPRNYLIRLELAQMLGDLGERDRALAAIDQVMDLQRRGAPGYAKLQPEKLAYLKGNLLFWFDDYSKAADELRKAAQGRERLDLNTGLLAALRLGQTFDLMGKRAEAQQAYRLGIELAPSSEIAKECQQYLGRAYKRSKIPV